MKKHGMSILFAIVVSVALGILCVATMERASDDQKLVAKIAMLDDPTVCEFGIDETFTVATAPEDIKGTDIKIAIVKREKDDAPFRAIIANNRMINVGDRVRVLMVNYDRIYNDLKRDEFLLVK